MRSYIELHITSYILRVIGSLSMLGAIILLFIGTDKLIEELQGLLPNQSLISTLRADYSFIALVELFLAGLFMVAIGQVILVLIDIARNTSYVGQVAEDTLLTVSQITGSPEKR